MRYSSAGSKADATARMYALAGEPTEPLGPGSKEKRSALEALGRFLGIEERLPPGKTEAGRAIAQHLGAVWDDACYSRGDSITLVGLNRLIDAAVAASLSTHQDAAALIVRGMNAELPAKSPTTVDAAQSQELNVPEDLNEIEENIAELVAQLSDTAQAPEGVERSPRAIEPESVRLDDGSWRERLMDIQGWLHLPSDLDAAGHEVFDESLATALGLDGGAAGGTPILFAKLEERLERATALRDAFVTRMDGTSEGTETLATASLAWNAAWEDVEEEEEDEEESEGAPINAEADTWPISEFVQHAEDDELNLSPSYQRADVWPTGDAQLLIESVLRGIPLPSVIILQDDDGVTTTYEVVDGKQRLTSILRFIGKHPRATALVNEKAALWGSPDAPRLFREDYPGFKKLWNTNESEKLTAQVERRLYFPFALRRPNRGPLSPTGSLSILKGKFYTEIRDETIQVQGLPKKIRSVFEQTSAYKIPVITYKKVTPAQVHEVFSLYNKQGKHLNAEEIRNALYHELDLMTGLLVTAGDAANVAEVAPFLKESWGDLSSTATTLEGYGFGTVGYKRTKLLSWALASLLLDDGVQGRSTASHINALLKRVEEDKKDPMRTVTRVTAAMMMLDHGLDAHAIIESNDGWAPNFRNAQGKGKWQELQLVAGMIGLAAASLVLGDDLEGAVDDATPAILGASQGWKRPASAQSKDQWAFIATVVGELLDVLEVEADAAHETIQKAFGQSGLATLLRA